MAMRALSEDKGRMLHIKVCLSTKLSCQAELVMVHCLTDWEPPMRNTSEHICEGVFRGLNWGGKPQSWCEWYHGYRSNKQEKAFISLWIMSVDINSDSKFSVPTMMTITSNHDLKNVLSVLNCFCCLFCKAARQLTTKAIYTKKQRLRLRSQYCKSRKYKQGKVTLNFSS